MPKGRVFLLTTAVTVFYASGVSIIALGMGRELNAAWLIAGALIFWVGYFYAYNWLIRRSQRR